MHSHINVSLHSQLAYHRTSATVSAQAQVGQTKLITTVAGAGPAGCGMYFTIPWKEVAPR